jgi:hypothetical protein
MLLAAALFGAVGFVGGPAAGASAPSAAGAAKYPTVTIRAQDFSYVMPAKITAGIT